jgi:hypothetical protein
MFDIVMLRTLLMEEIHENQRAIDGEAFGIDLEEVDKTKLLISRINDRHIFPHIKISFMVTA